MCILESIRLLRGPLHSAEEERKSEENYSEESS
jgi:hypothetical protein